MGLGSWTLLLAKALFTGCVGLIALQLYLSISSKDVNCYYWVASSKSSSSQHLAKHDWDWYQASLLATSGNCVSSVCNVLLGILRLNGCKICFVLYWVWRCNYWEYVINCMILDFFCLCSCEFQYSCLKARKKKIHLIIHVLVYEIFS